jgi:6-phosphogluconate dehydrogenase (decarboxylating)
MRKEASFVKRVLAMQGLTEGVVGSEHSEGTWGVEDSIKPSTDRPMLSEQRWCRSSSRKRSLCLGTTEMSLCSVSKFRDEG